MCFGRTSRAVDKLQPATNSATSCCINRAIVPQKIYGNACGFKTHATSVSQHVEPSGSTSGRLLGLRNLKKHLKPHRIVVLYLIRDEKFIRTRVKINYTNPRRRTFQFNVHSREGNSNHVVSTRERHYVPGLSCGESYVACLTHFRLEFPTRSFLDHRKMLFVRSRVLH